MSEVTATAAAPAPAPRPKYVPAVGPRLKRLLMVVFVILALLGANSGYLAAITGLEWATGQTYQDSFYLWMVLGHVALGVIFLGPFLAFGRLAARCGATPCRLAVLAASAGGCEDQMASRSGISWPGRRDPARHDRGKISGSAEVECRRPQRRSRQILLPVIGAHCHWQLHPCQNVADGRLLSEMPSGCSRRLEQEFSPF
jgi:hypothetical protein